ncbi:MAG TPA: hypothetical protein P5307_16955 [Pirellulaceae bacterium]|nr:hypothetical protein [Planctomycetales bacterium]MCB9937433.1 hypothetical protein [Planctomycetaceae bacterium]HRX80763.1 hypothetical protein [Pirellulaceae bacterium]
MKLKLDAAALKRHPADYEQAIGKRAPVLVWSSTYHEDEMAEAAIEKFASLRQHLAAC